MSRPTTAATVAALAYYPIKGCAACTPVSAAVTAAGLRHDRAFMVVDADGVFRTQRRDPGLAVVAVEITTDGERLRLVAAGRPALEIPIRLDGPRRPVELFGVGYRGVDQGEEVAAWFTEHLGRPSRLVRVPPDHQRHTSGLTPGTAGFADGHAITVISQSSVDALNARIAASGGDPVTMDRFRCNIVLSGWPAHTEDLVRRMDIGDAQFGYAKLDLRCVVTTVDQQVGIKRGLEPLRTLARYRRSQGGVAFGMKAAVLQPGTVSVGDAVRVLDWGDSEL